MSGTAVARRLEVAAITFDFGNTLVRVDRAGLAAVVREMAGVLRERRIAADEVAFLAAWEEERARQFREELPRFREVSLRDRVVRVLARQRGMAPPPATESWDDEVAGRRVAPAEVDVALDAYSSAFVARMPPEPDASAVLERLSGTGFALGILSNWPLAETVERYVAERGWLPQLRAIVVSERVGTIKPHRAIFDHARERLAAPAARILHVGDDWAADVVGASRAGWRAAYLRDRQGDTPLPTSAPPKEVPPTVESGDAGTLDDELVAGTERADLVLAELTELPALVGRWEGSER